MSLNSEIPMTLREISELPEVKGRWTYGTLRTYSSKDDKFPKPARTNLRGHGILWYKSQVITYLKLKPDNRGRRRVSTLMGVNTRYEQKESVPCAAGCNTNVVIGTMVVCVVDQERVAVDYYHTQCADIKGIQIAA